MQWNTKRTTPIWNMLTLQKKAKITKCKTHYVWLATLIHTHSHTCTYFGENTCALFRWSIASHFHKIFLKPNFLCRFFSAIHLILSFAILFWELIPFVCPFVSIRLFNEQRWKQKANKKWKNRETEMEWREKNDRMCVLCACIVYKWIKTRFTFGWSDIAQYTYLDGIRLLQWLTTYTQSHRIKCSNAATNRRRWWWWWCRAFYGRYILFALFLLVLRLPACSSVVVAVVIGFVL